MRIIRPTQITTAMVVDCDVPEDEHLPWASSTNYLVNDYCVYEHKIYQCLIGNSNHLPTSYVDTVPPFWLDWGYTNRWKMFDSVVGSQTSQADSLSVTVAPGLIDSIAFLDVEGTTIDIVMTDPVEGVVYTETVDLIGKSVTVDWYTYFFEPIITEDTAVLLYIPPYVNATVEVTISNTSGVAKIGTLILGTQKDLGLTEANPTIEITDYSRKEVDTFGNYTVVQRAFSKKLSCELMLPNSMVDDLQKTLASYRATPVLWIGYEGFSSMIIYGFYKSFSIRIPYIVKSFCSIEIEGLT